MLQNCEEYNNMFRRPSMRGCKKYPTPNIEPS